jgi:hypothetical protein
MNTTQNVLVFGLVAAGVALTVACSSSSSSDGSSGSSGGTSSGSTSSGSTSSGSTSSGGSGFKDCSSSGSSGSSGCTAAELKPYTDCVTAACDSTYKQCYGNAYATGTFAGPCGSYITCIQKCNCGDTACYQACGTPSSDCQTCQQGLASCSGGCTLPACATASSSSSSSSSSGGTAKTCADLQTCCDAITDPTIKSTCQSSHDSAASSDATCNVLYNTYKTYCP